MSTKNQILTLIDTSWRYLMRDVKHAHDLALKAKTMALDSHPELITKSEIAIAATIERLNKPVKAAAIIKKIEKNTVTNGIALAQLKYVKGNTYKDIGNYTKALSCYIDSLLICKEKKDEILESYIYHMMGISHKRLGDYDNALKNYVKAIRLKEKQKEQNGLGAVQMEIGVMYLDMGDLLNAKKYLKKSVSLRKKIKDEWGTATSLMNLGVFHNKEGNFKEALSAQKQSIELREKHNDTKGLRGSYHYLASTYHELKKFDTALTYYYKSLELCKKSNDKYGISLVSLHLGKTYTAKNEINKAEKYYQNSLLACEKIKSNQLLSEIYEALVQHFEHLSDFKKSLKYHKKFHEIQQKTINEETNLKLKNTEIRFRLENITNESKIYRKKNKELEKINLEINKKQREIEMINQSLIDSLDYASTIQKAILPKEEEVKKHFEDFFALYIPKSIVSGDFYWFSSKKDCDIIVVADCTGHGVPGALMTMMGNSILNNIIDTREIYDPGKIVNEIDKAIQKAFKSKSDSRKTTDGMDVAVIEFHKNESKISFSSARANFFILNNGEIETFKGETKPIGFSFKSSPGYKTYTKSINSGDQIYMMSDGFQDQFGENNKKFMLKRVLDLIKETEQLSMQKQKERFKEEFLNWKGDKDQTDDILLVGIKV